MNQITRAAAAMSDGGILLGVMTALFMAFFVAVAIYLLLRSEESYDDIAKLAVDDDEPKA